MIRKLFANWFVLFILACSTGLEAYAQSTENEHPEEQCAIDHRHNTLMLTAPGYAEEQQANELLIQEILDGRTNLDASRNEILTVPVVVHIIRTGQPVGTGANISDEQVHSAIEALNEDYRKMAGTNGDGDGVDCHIEFCLAQRDPDGNPTTGINRVNGSSVPLYSTEGITAGVGQGANEMSVKNLSRWPNQQYYNIWIVTEIENNNGLSGIQGYAYYPTTSIVDGSVILFNAFGTVGNLKSYTNMNRTTTHELGHALNLYHTFNGQSCTETNCTLQGDRVCDTPPTTQNSICTLPACSGTQQVENYMDYTSQLCKNLFTAGQRDRMRAALLGPRANLLTSLACVPPNAPEPPVAQFSASATTICAGSQVTFTNQSTGSISSYQWNFPGGSPASSTAQNPPAVTYTNPGTYNVQLTVTNAGGSDTETKSNYITVNATSIYYLDNDGDGYGNPNTAINSCSPPANYVSNGQDCNDNNANDWDSCYDCAGMMNGSATEDNCGVCDTNPNNDCQQDCAGVWGGNAEEDNCGVCDTNPNNNCVQDCAGVWGGNALEDNCGVCDTNPNNDCQQDCAGVWGGSAYEDDCGVCDANPNNDCDLCENFSLNVSSVVEPQCAGSATGSITVEVSGGMAPFTLVWSHSETLALPQATNLAAGSYTATVTDAQGCQAEVTITLTDPDGFVISDSGTSPASCLTQTGGAAWIFPTGGQAPYTIAWSDGQVGNTADDLSQGTYTATVTDDTGCQETFSLEVALDTCPQIPTTQLADAQCQGGVIAQGGTLLCTPVEFATAYRWRLSHEGSVAEVPTNEPLLSLQGNNDFEPGDTLHVEVAADRWYGEGEFGAVCTLIVEPQVPATQLASTWCNAVGVAFHDTLQCIHVAEALAYRWEIVGGGLNDILETTTSQLAVSEIGIIEENTSYTVVVYAQVAGFWGDEAVACSITTGNFTADVAGFDCGTALSILDTLYCDPIPDAINYRWKFVDAQTAEERIHFSQNQNRVWLFDVPGLQFDKSYDVSVTAQTASSAWSPGSSVCNVGINRYIRGVEVAETSCDYLDFTDPDYLGVQPLPGADQYLLHFTRQSGDTATLLEFLAPGADEIAISQLNELEMYTLYRVKARARVRGQWGQWGNACDFAKGGLTDPNPFEPFVITRIYPNPGDGQEILLNTNLNRNQNSAFTVYNVNGQIVDRGALQLNEKQSSAELSFSNSLQPGMYYIRFEFAHGTETHKYVVQ